LLHRGLLVAQELLPGIREDLLIHGAVPFDTGTIAWLGEYGWLPTWIPSYEIVSTTRPLLEHLIRKRVRDLDGVTARKAYALLSCGATPTIGTLSVRTAPLCRRIW
jgi:hypothetical protein